MFDKILVPLGDSLHTCTALHNAGLLARIFKSTVTCLYVLDKEKIEMTYLSTPVLGEVIADTEAPDTDNVVGTLSAAIEKEAELILKYHEAAQKEFPEVDFELERVEGNVDEEILSRDDEFDLLIMGKSMQPEDEGYGVLGDHCRNIIHKANTPVLLVTHSYLVGSNLMACYDGSEPADNALNIAVETAKGMDVPLNVLTTWWNQKTAERINKKAIDRIKDRGVELVPLVHHMNTVGTILAEVDHLDINFLFMGAYGESKLKDLLLGGTTDQVIRGTGCPILMYR